MAALTEILSHAFIWAALVGYVVGGIALLRIRRRTRAALFVDSLIRTVVPLATVQIILVVAEANAGTHDHTWGWVGVTGILAALAVYLLWPIWFLGRMGSAGDGYVLFSRALLGGLHTKLEDLYGPGPSRVIAYGIGKTAGEKDATAALKANQLSPERWWSLMPYIFRATGLGKLKLKRVELGKEVELSIDDCFEAYHDHLGGVPGCDLTRGYFAGLGKALHPELECQTEETRCASVDGGKTCEFTIRWFEPVPMPHEVPAAVASGA